MPFAAAVIARFRTLREVENRIRGFSPVGDGRIPRRMSVCVDPACTVCRDGLSSDSGGRIVYLLPSADVPIGGSKISCRQIDILADKGVACVGFHPETPPGFTYSWFAHRIRTLRSGHFDPKRDFLVFPEIWAAIASRFCVPYGIHYAIYVQNGYLAHNSAGFSDEDLRRAYRHADLVLSVSADTSEIISLTYPFVEPARILRLFQSVPAQFAPRKKEKLITYMPRKLKEHSDRMRCYLAPVIPGDWRFQAIDGLDERGVAEVMSRSSIFMSFSELEGFGLPPIEAALSGNIVVGYTGQGGREYFAPPAFREVPNGDFLRFVSEVRMAIANAETELSASRAFVLQMHSLAAIYSIENETRHLMTFAQRVAATMGSSAAPATCASKA